MNLIELEKEIGKLDIKKQFFGINKKPLYEGHYIIKENKWRVYYYERGCSNLLKEFDAESEAAEFMLEKISKNYSTK